MYARGSTDISMQAETSALSLSDTIPGRDDVIVGFRFAHCIGAKISRANEHKRCSDGDLHRGFEHGGQGCWKALLWLCYR